ncbi:MAG TPA: hypothetical protein VK895_11815 [Jiangellaceae bacterium]|nr:hypothetical protein [Jiangellaceae bacterium]
MRNHRPASLAAAVLNASALTLTFAEQDGRPRPAEGEAADRAIAIGTHFPPVLVWSRRLE